MLKQEFLNLMGWGNTMITDEQYSEIEKAYMNSDESKQDFCKRMYSVYKETVVKAIDRAIHNSPLDEKETYIAGGNLGFEQKLDIVKNEKMNLLISLLA